MVIKLPPCMNASCSVIGALLSSLLSLIKYLFDEALPQLFIRSKHPTIVGVQAVDFTLDIRSLGPHGAAAGIEADLFGEFAEQDLGAVVVCFQVVVEFVGLVDGVDGLLNVPQTRGS